MKAKFSRLLSLLLTLSLLLSSFAVFALAAEDGEVGTDEPSDEELVPVVAYNRDYADGWGVYNGVGNEATIGKDHGFTVDKELAVDYSYNYFARITAVDTANKFNTALGSTDGFFQIDLSKLGNPDTNHVFLEFDIKVDDLCNLGTVLYMRTEGSSAKGTHVNLLSITNGKLLAMGVDDKVGTDIADKWTHVIIDLDYTNELNAPDAEFDLRMTVGEQTWVKKIKANNAGYIGADIFRFGLTAAASIEASALREGESWCIDNLQCYFNTDRRLTEEELDAQGYGVLVNVNQAKSVVIDGSAAGKSTLDYLNESLCMKVNVNYALKSGERVAITDGSYGAPVVHDGRIVVPFEIILDYMGTGYLLHDDGLSYDISTGVSATYLTIGRDLATVDGKVVTLTMAPGYYTDPETGNKYAVIALDDVETLFPGYYVTYDSMGLIIIGGVDNILNREDHLSDMLALMNRFIYNFIDEDTVYELAKEKTNDFTHPYILADQEVFDRLIAIWNGTDTTDYGVPIKSFLTSQVNRAYSIYKSIALPDPLLDDGGNPVTDENGDVVYGTTYDAYHGLDWSRPNTQVLIYPHVPTNGYDPYGGRQAESGTVANWAHDIAFGYIITGDIKLAQLAYDILVELGEWNHWCPGHFLNTADAAKSYAVAFDWIYNGIAALEAGEYDGKVETGVDGVEPGSYYKNSYIEKLLYKNGVRMGYLASTKQHHGWTRPQGDVYYYNTMANNWNAVCSSGIWIASLALLGSDVEGELGPNEKLELAPVKETSAWVISHTIETMALYGMTQYAPDGSYVESPGYWGYGTNSLYYGLMALWRCLGDDFGFLDAPGMDKTCYFACNIESSDFNQFSYHDASIYQSVDSSSFYFVAEAMGDPVLAEIRKLHNNNGKGMSIRDALFFPYDGVGSSSEVELPLDYYAEGIDAFTTRSSWEPGALFAGIIAGDNNASHGQIDSGTFVYHNAGKIWIVDIGADEYNIYNYFTSPDRYRYYRMNAEGNNTAFITSQPIDLPFGQKLQGAGDITKWFSNDFGSYTIIDNTPVYGGLATTARRGMLLTNNRKTLVIQDEMNMAGVETICWAAHFESNTTEWEISNNGRTLFLYEIDEKGERTGKILRLSIVSNSAYEKFTVTTAGETEEDRLLKGSQGTVDYGWSTSMGALVSEKSRADLKRILVKATTNTLQMAVVIELVDDVKQLSGYSRFTPMNEWVPTGTVEVPDDTDEPTKRGAPKITNIGSYVRSINSMLETGRAYNLKLREHYLTLCNLYYIEIRFFPDELAEYATQLDQYHAAMEEYNKFISSINQSVTSSRDVALQLMGV